MLLDGEGHVEEQAELSESSSEQSEYGEYGCSPRKTWFSRVGWGVYERVESEPCRLTVWGDSSPNSESRSSSSGSITFSATAGGGYRLRSECE